MGSICVLGSANMDYVVRVTQLPQPGETVGGEDLLTVFGGKGANSAVAAARLGGNVQLVGCVGSDAAGQSYLQHLRDEEVDVTYMRRSTDRPTGSALILVDGVGQNMIAVAPGANNDVCAGDVQSAANVISQSAVLLCQFEVPLDCVAAAIGIANDAGVPVVLNPSPMNPRFDWKGGRIDYLLVNEGEARSLAGNVTEVSASAVRSRGFGTVVITRGADPTLYSASDAEGQVNTFSVEPVDTVGAGDTFAGAFAVALSREMPIEEAIRFANAAGALATTRMGAQASMPRLAELEQLLTAM